MNYSPLLAWAEATGRMRPEDRGAFVNHMLAGREAAVVETLLGAEPDLKLGDFPAPHPWGIGDPVACASRDAAQLAAKRGRNVFASKGTHRPASPFELRKPVKASTPPPAQPAGSLSSVVDVTDVPAPAGPRPKLFGDSELPAFCASGIDPKTLQQVPWQARPAMARAKTPAEAFEVLDWYSGDGAEVAAAVDSEPGRALYADVAEYETRLSAWASTPAGHDPTRGHGIHTAPEG